MFTRKEYATSVSGKTANGCPVRSAKPPDNMNFHFILPCGAKLYEIFFARWRTFSMFWRRPSRTSLLRVSVRCGKL